MKVLKASKEIEVRFSEVDSMKVVWHGSYPLYLEDAREFFGKKYVGLGYDDFKNHNYHAPIVEMNIKYIKPILYGMTIRVDIVYRWTPSAKVVFDYMIFDKATDVLLASGYTTQVFTDMNYQLVLTNPAFYEEWKKRWGIVC